MLDFLVNVVLLVVGFAMLVKGADWFVDGSAGIATKMGIPQLVVGLTLVAMGTSAPEAAVSISASLQENSADIAIGNVLGSNILNIFIILGLTAVITSVAIQKSTLAYEMPFMIMITIILVVLGMGDGYVNRLEGVILWLLFIGYMAYLLILAKKGKAKEKEKRSYWMLLLLMTVGGAIVVWGSDITVDSATKIATMIGIDARFIGLTIVALGTSLPELVTSVTAAKKGNADIAIGNIVGSNVFNILFVIGTSSLITPVKYQSAFLIDGIIAVACGVLLWVSVVRTKKLTRPWGIAMLVGYAAYFIYLLTSQGQ